MIHIRQRKEFDSKARCSDICRTSDIYAESLKHMVRRLNMEIYHKAQKNQSLLSSTFSFLETLYGPNHSSFISKQSLNPRRVEGASLALCSIISVCA